MSLQSTFSTISALLSGLSLAARNPVFSGAGVAISAVLDLASSLVARGEAGAAELEKLTEEIKAMVAEGRQPTAAEWKSLRSRSDAAHAILQGTPASAPEPEKPVDSGGSGDGSGGQQT
jgi:hypothetical protein